MKYVITDGTHFIGRSGGISDGKFIVLEDFSKSVGFTNTGALNFLDRLPSDCKGYGWTVQPKDTFSIDTVKLIENKKDYNLVSIADSLQSLCAELLTYYDSEMQKLKNVEFAIMDIEHAAEFQNLNVVNGYKLYKLLQEKRLERRKIKDDINMLDHMMHHRFEEYGSGKVVKDMGLDRTKKYCPRVLTELFETKK